MKGGPQAALVLGVGYVLGRRRKLRLAMLIAGATAAGGIGGIGGAALRRGVKTLGSTEMISKLSPQLGDITDVLRNDLLDAGRAAASAAVNGRIESLTDSLHDRAETLRNPAAAAAGGAAGGATEAVRGLRRKRRAAPEPDEADEAGEAGDESAADEAEDQRPRGTRRRRGRDADDTDDYADDLDDDYDRDEADVDEADLDEPDLDEPGEDDEPVGAGRRPRASRGRSPVARSRR